MRFIVILIPALVLTAGIASAADPETAATPTVAPAAAEQGKDVVHALNNAFAKVFDAVAPAVVVIEITKKNDGTADSPFDDLFFQGPQDNDTPRRPRNSEPLLSEGSGFVVRNDGFILTNYHVVEGADKIDVKLRDGREFQGKLVGTDERTDLAVVKIEANNLPVIDFADSDSVRVGQFAFAIGAPYKLDYTFTYGVISAKGRSKLISVKGYSIPDYIQTDAAINPGNSGGPLCDIDGKVIGINTLINGLNRGLGFAIPSNLAKEIGTELIAGHKIVRPWLGIEIRTLGEEPFGKDLFKGVDKGVVVRTIQADTPASKTDLRPGDVITQVDGAPVETDSQLQHEILKKKVGQNVDLGIWRKGQTMKIPVKTGELPSDLTAASNEPAKPEQPPKQEQQLGKFGIQVQELTKEMADQMHLTVDKGVIVTDVTDDSIAARQGVERGDVITEVDNKPVTDVKSFRDALNKADPKRGVLLYLDRKGNKTFAVLKAGS
jgi:serine protease Do